MEELLVVKIGGNVIDSEEALNSFLRNFTTIPGNKVLVHGGGKLATQMSAQLGIPTQIINGRRVTDIETVKVVTMVYAGWINKTITAKLQANGCKTIGLSGADAALLPAVKRPVTDIDYGWVGDLIADHVNTALLQTLLTAGNTVVVAPITANNEGNLLNVNADTVASVIAEGMSKLYRTTLIYCFEKNGLLRDVNDNNSVVAEIKTGEINTLKEQGIITDGMLPKIDNAAAAINKGVSKVVIGNAMHIKQLANGQPEYGTHITA
jgi:acetylglutamate kinase